MVKQINKWGNKEWGNMLIILGIVFMLGGVMFTQPFAVVGFEFGGAKATVGGLSQASASSIFIGIVLLIAGIYLRTKK
ncbi:hypothetical protein CMO93_01345 [Candidatus Woesearchaeota archaeon]|nr:hypothetical protein [Candidatus Woesearchaeota archaeon]|tara:strand:- start:752 stop:985 length:234 start_codon:yes stop_codon:yes gene_type:complete